jgi:hypothetical protein
MRDRNYYRQENQQQLIDHNSSVVQNNYALNMTLEIKVEGDEASSIRNNRVVNFIGSKTRISNDIHFIMCQSCFWCASYINRSRLLMSIDNKCPLCHDSRIESMPISYDEIYRLNYNRTSGLVLKFSRE